MTGMECLKQEMEKRGATKSQIESKTLLMVVDILAQTGTAYLNARDAEEEAEKAKREAREARDRKLSLDAHIRTLSLEAQELNSAAEKRAQAIYDKIDEAVKYVDEWKSALSECETKEGRDRMRLAQMFINSVTVDTKYDNTAYIIALGSIICGSDAMPMERLKKINPKLFDTDEETKWMSRSLGRK